MGRLFCSCALGLEKLLQEELETILVSFHVRKSHKTAVKAAYGGCYVEAALENLYAINFASRLTMRTLWPLRRFKLWKPRNLYQQLVKVDWREWLEEEESFCFRASGKNRHFPNRLYACQLAKDALVDQFRGEDPEGARPRVETKDPSLSIHLHLDQDEVEVRLDATGKGLHLRGYAPEAPEGEVEAPLNATVAAALVMVARKTLLQGSKTCFQRVLDPCCGGGTLLLEALAIEAKLPLGLLRLKNIERPYSFLSWKLHQEALWTRVQDHFCHLFDQTLPTLDSFTCEGGEIQAGALKLAKRREESLRDYFQGESKIHLEQVDLEQLPLEEEGETDRDLLLICNPPFGKRLSTLSGMAAKLRALALSCRASCLLWVGSEEDFAALYGAKENEKSPSRGGYKKLLEFYVSGSKAFFMALKREDQR